jgi:ubiquinone/menaquinone biosynthesis C-methylase UbiE
MAQPTNVQAPFIPALSFRWLTAIYDPLLRWGMQERGFKQKLIERAELEPRQRVLDVGCGTGTLTVMVKESAPTALVTGIDGDPDVLVRARRKAEKSNLPVRWDHGMAYDLPYSDHTFDVILSSLVIHHLTTPDKLRAFREIRRVLKPKGRFHMVDFGRPFSPVTRVQAAVMRGLEQVADNFAGHIPMLLKEAGFGVVLEEQPFWSVFGPLWFYEAH